MTNIVRSPTWVLAPFVEDLSGAPGTNKVYSEEEKEAFREKILESIKNTFMNWLMRSTTSTKHSLRALQPTSRLNDEHKI